MLKIGLLGGSGFDDSRLIENIEQVEVSTPFGLPSDKLTIGNFEGIDLVILARHGKGHTIYPTGVNYRANIWAMKELGVTHIIATTAVGSLREKIAPGHLVLPDQFIDRTTKRHSTFYEKDTICHIPMAEPFCPKLRGILKETADSLSLTCYEKGTVITIEGPRFSTKAESYMFRSWGADIINMSTVPEVVLAREAGICYVTVAMSTDYDCWHESKEPVTWEMVMKVMGENVSHVKELFFASIKRIDFIECSCKEAVKASLMS
ncbi:MAG: S-methyl-5'-thioadenosine phosphorylase [bacterium]